MEAIACNFMSISSNKSRSVSAWSNFSSKLYCFKVDKVFVQTPGPDAGKEIGE